MNYKKCVIAIDDWQMQCCGTPFKLGDDVEWILHRHGKKSKLTDNMVEFYYEHHSSEWENLFKATGAVDKIEALFCRYEKRPNEHGNKKGFVNYAIYEKALNVDAADGWHGDVDGLKFVAYEVTLRDCVIVPAKKTEVTFS